MKNVDTKQTLSSEPHSMLLIKTAIPLESLTASLKEDSEGEKWLWNCRKGGVGSRNDSADKKAQGCKGGGNVVKVRRILCEKHGKIMGAMEKLRSGMRFSDVLHNTSKIKPDERATRDG